MNKKFFIYMSLFSMLLYPINDLLCAVVCLTSLICTIVIDKDKITLQKVIQPTLVLTFAYALKGLLLLFIGIITNFAKLGDSYYSSSIYENSTNFMLVIESILTIVILVTFITMSILFILKKDFPGLDKIANHFVSVSSDSKETKKETKKSKEKNNNASVKSEIKAKEKDKNDKESLK